jgi:hypothetical protein
MTDADTHSLFDRSDDEETDITSTADTNSPSEIDDDIDDNTSLFDNEVRHPLKHYLNEVANSTYSGSGSSDMTRGHRTGSTRLRNTMFSKRNIRTTSALYYLLTLLR